jgi:hypothetical protein
MRRESHRRRWVLAAILLGLNFLGAPGWADQTSDAIRALRLQIEALSQKAQLSF